MIAVTGGYSYSGSDNNFDRDYFPTIEAMKSVKAPKMPQMFIAMCGETGKAYLYNKANTATEDLGKWEEIGSGAENSKTSFPINFINYYHNGKIGEVDRDLVDPQCYRDYESFDLFALAIKKELTKVKYNLLRPTGVGGNPVEEITSVKRYTGDVYDTEGLTVMADNDFNYKKYLRIEFNGSYYVVINTEEKTIAGFYGAFAIAREEVNTGSSCECEEETDTIDFSTWPEFSPNLDAGGITLDGQGGANVDGSNVSVDPDDIEPDD